MFVGIVWLVVSDRSEIQPMALVCEWVVRIGHRNIGYVVFVSLLVPFGTLMEAMGPKGPTPTLLGPGISGAAFSDRGEVALTIGQTPRHRE